MSTVYCVCLDQEGAVKNSRDVVARPDAVMPRTDMLRRLHGHAWTIAPTLRHRVKPFQGPEAVPWSTTLHDPVMGEIQLTGLFQDQPESDTLVLVLHGLGGTATSAYCFNGARAAEQAGFACLRIYMRGADRSGEDVYHIGLTEDLEAALQSDEVRRFKHVFLLGYSLGGHTVMRAALDEVDPRITAVAAICPPIDLHASQKLFDTRREQWFYRRDVLRSLKGIYRNTAARRSLTFSYRDVRRVRTLWDWDRLVVIPRFGYHDVFDYYLRESMVHRLHAARHPMLVVMARNDPMVLADTVEHALISPPHTVQVRWVQRGGHVLSPPPAARGTDTAPGHETPHRPWRANKQCH